MLNFCFGRGFVFAFDLGRAATAPFFPNVLLREVLLREVLLPEVLRACACSFAIVFAMAGSSVCCLSRCWSSQPSLSRCSLGGILRSQLDEIGTAIGCGLGSVYDRLRDFR